MKISWLLKCGKSVGDECSYNVSITIKRLIGSTVYKRNYIIHNANKKEKELCYD